MVFSMVFRDRNFGFVIWCLGVRVWDSVLGFVIWCLRFRILEFEISSLGF